MTTKRAFLLVVVVLALATLACGGTPAPDVGNRYGAQVVCEKFVKKNLVAPSTAKFASPDSVTKLSGKPDSWRVVGHLDAQNRMGAMLRLNYTCDTEGDNTVRGLLVVECRFDMRTILPDTFTQFFCQFLFYIWIIPGKELTPPFERGIHLCKYLLQDHILIVVNDLQFLKQPANHPGGTTLSELVSIHPRAPAAGDVILHLANGRYLPNCVDLEELTLLSQRAEKEAGLS